MPETQKLRMEDANASKVALQRTTNAAVLMISHIFLSIDKHALKHAEKVRFQLSILLLTILCVRAMVALQVLTEILAPALTNAIKCVLLRL